MQMFTNNEIPCYNECMTKAFKTVYTLLNRLEKALDYADFDAEKEIGHEALGITKTRWINYLEMLNEAGYISGVKTKNFIDGSFHLDISSIRITLHGLQYLAENTMMLRVFNTVKEVKNLIP